MSEIEHNRKSDEIVFRMEQKLDDHIRRFERFESEICSWRKEHAEWADAEKAKITARLGIIEAVWISIEKPVKYVGWAITIFLAVLITSSATLFKDWVASHFKR